MAQNTITTKGVLIINGKQVESTFNELYSRTKKLQQELKKLKPGTQEFLDKAAELKRVKAEFDAVRKEIFATNQEIKKGGGIFSRFFGSIAGGLTQFEILTKVKNIFTSTTQDLLKISDAMTDVQKTSGLAQKQIEALWSEFGKFNTRTSRMELMNIAQIGGRLGITDKEQLQEFTREIDKIYVALGDSFQGGLEEVTTKVGKLKNLFDETKGSDYPSALNEIGSALNELGANGTASESNITEFATRIGQLPNALKPAIDKTLGLGAAFEESGIDAQIASSGYSRFMSVAGNNLDAFAQQMKISKEEATELFRTKPEEFFIRFGESMKGIPADQTAKILKNLDLNTLEVKKSLGAAGDNADRFRQMMELSSKAMIEGVSIHNEFSQKNENAAAVWEKIARGFREFFTDGVIPDIFNWVTEIAGKITGVISEAGDGVERFRARLSFIAKTLAVVTVAVFSYRAALWLTAKTTKSAWQQTILYNTVLKVQEALKRAGAAASHLFSAAKLALTGNTQRAAVAMRAFNMAVRTNPIGLLVSVLVAAGTALYLFNQKTDQATEKQKRLANQQLRVQNSIDDERIKLEQLLAVARDETLSKNDREDAIKQLNKLSPEYLGNLKLEEINTLQAKKATEAYIKSLEKKALLEILNEDLKENLRKKREAQNKNVANYDKGLISQGFDWVFGETQMEEDIEKQLDKLMTPFENKGFSEDSLKKQRESFRKNIQHHYQAKQKDLDALDKEKEDLQAQIQELLKENPKSIIEGNTELTDDGSGKKTKKYTGDLYGQAQKDLLKAQRDFIKKQQELEDEETAILEDSLDKQLSAVETKYERKKFALQHENEDITNEISDLNKKIREANEKIADPETTAEEKADNSRAIGVYKKIIEEKRNLIEQNNKMEVTLESTKNHELNTTREKYFTKLIQTQNKEFEKCLNLKKAQSDLEIAEIKTLEHAKQKLQEQGYEGQLHKIRTLEDAKKVLRKQAEKEILADTLQSLEAQHALLVSGIQSVSGESAQKLTEDLDKLNEKILQIKTAIATGEVPDTKSIKGTEAEGVDVLGFTAGQWEDVFHRLDTTEGKLQAVGMAMQALANAGQMFADAQRSANERELRQFTNYQEHRKKELANQLNAGLITQEQYHKSIRQMEIDTANKKAELEEKQFRAEKIGRLFSAIGSTAQAVAAALTAGPIMGPILAGVVGALGAVQIGIINAQQPPSRQTYEKGGYTQGLGFSDHTGHEVAGVVHAQEYVIPQWLLKQPQVAHVVEWLETKRKGKTENLQSFDQGALSDSNKISYQQNDNQTRIEPVLYRLTEVLEKIEKEGLETFLLADAQNGKKMHEAIKKYQNLQQKSKGTNS